MSDRDLLDRYLESGNLEVLGILYSRYIHLVFGVCLKYLPDREEAKDAVMDIFEKLIIDLEKHQVENFKSWLYVLTRNFCLMRLRKDKKRLASSRAFEENEMVFMENNGEMHPVDRDELLSDKALKECIEGLKAEQRKCIELFYYEKRCYREIADEMNIDEKKVKSHLQNAKRNLKICLEADDGKKN